MERRDLGALRIHEFGRGIRAGIAAYVIWGLLTIYWKQLAGFNARGADRLADHVGVAGDGGRRVRARAGGRRSAPPSPIGPLTIRIAVAAALLTANWTSYVYAVVHDRVIETALGYFMAPLGTMVLGITVLKERPSARPEGGPRARLRRRRRADRVVRPAAGLAALVMAVTWSVYGLLKRRVPLAAVDSFAAESFVLVVPAVIVVAATAGLSDSIPRTADGRATSLLVSLSGVATALP